MIKVLASATGLSALGLPLLADAAPASALADAPVKMPLPSNGSSAKTFYHGAAYYPELWPETAIDADIAHMHELGINVVRMGEFAWAKMEPDEGKISLDFFVKVMDRLHAAGIGTVFCTPTPTPPIWLTHGHPERCLVNAEGAVMSHGSRQHASYDHPDVQAACTRITEALAQAVGRHPGMVAWQIDNELKCHVAEDFSAASVARWHRWLETRYKTVEALNEAWGAEIWSERYQRFDQVPAPRATPFVHHASLQTAYRLFSRECVVAFTKEQAGILRKHSRAPVTHNMSLGFSQHLEAMCGELDFASFDNYPPSSRYLAMVMDCDLFRAAKPGRPFWVMETSSAHNGWLKDHEPAHPIGFLVAEAVACYGLGAEAFCYWLWRQQRAGCEMPHSAILSAWAKPGLGYDRVRDVNTARLQLAPILERTRPTPAEVALTWSDRGRVFLQTESLGSGKTVVTDYIALLTSWHELLVELGYHRDIRFEDAALDGLKLLITPFMPYVSATFRERVAAWVAKGGIWICGPLTGGRTKEQTAHMDAGLGALDAFAGVETVFSYPFSGTDAEGEAFGLTAPLTGWGHVFRPAHADAKTAGTVSTNRLPSKMAFLTERTIGRGAVVMLGGQLVGETGSLLLAKIIQHYAEQAGVTARFSTSKGTLVCPRVDDEGHRISIVVNLDGAGGHVRLLGSAKDVLTGEVLPSGDLKLGRYEYRVISV